MKQNIYTFLAASLVLDASFIAVTSVQAGPGDDALGFVIDNKSCAQHVLWVGSATLDFSRDSSRVQRMG